MPRWLVATVPPFAYAMAGGVTDQGVDPAAVAGLVVAGVAAVVLAALTARAPRPVWWTTVVLAGSLVGGVNATIADFDGAPTSVLVASAVVWPLLLAWSSWGWRVPEPPPFERPRLVALGLGVGVSVAIAWGLGMAWFGLTGIDPTTPAYIVAAVAVPIGAATELGPRRWWLVALAVAGVFAHRFIGEAISCLGCAPVGASIVLAVPGTGWLLDPADGQLVALTATGLGAVAGYVVGSLVRSLPMVDDWSPRVQAPTRF